MAIAPRNFKRQLDNAMPSAADAKLGTWLYELSAQLTALQAKYNALLAHLDAGNVAGIGNGNVATYGAASGNLLPEQR